MIQHRGEWMLVCDVQTMPAVAATPNGEEIHGVALRVRGRTCREENAFPDADHTEIYLVMTSEVRMRAANSLALLPIMEGVSWTNGGGIFDERSC